MFLSFCCRLHKLISVGLKSLARKAVVLCIEGMKNPTHSNEMLRIVLDLAMVHQSVFDLTFRRPVPERPDAVRCISHRCSLLICDMLMANECIITAVDRITPHNRRDTRTTGQSGRKDADDRCTGGM